MVREEFKDKILNICLKYPKKLISVIDICMKFITELNQQETRELLNEIKLKNVANIKTNSTNVIVGIEVNAFTKKFIEEGGFTKLAKEEKKRRDKSDIILDLDIKLKKFQAKTGRNIIIAAFIITVINFIFSFITFKYLIPDKNNVEQKVQLYEPKKTKLK
jgi:hypothetical protein